ncbi:MAG: aspartate/glutamate racemase family protein [Bacteroidota bacterium]
MKTLGLIGGTTWLSTIDYYRTINQIVNERLGGLSSAKILMYSLDLEEFRPPADPKDWGNRVGFLIGVAKMLEKGGADCLVLCANTPHLVADGIQKQIGIPLIHIADATANEVTKRKFTKVGLLGTRTTMEQPFFKDRLTKNGITTLLPDDGEREFIHANIFDELAKNKFKPETKKKYLTIIEKLRGKGAQGIILGCTEIPLLIKQSDCDLPLFDTTTLHAKAAAEFALQS